VIRAAFRLFGRKLVAISDSLRCAGMPDGQYELGGQPIEMRQGRATLLGSDTLAGSSTNLLAEVRKLVDFGISLEDAIYAVTEAPARAIRMEKELGVLAPGRPADFLLLNPDLTLHSTYINGKKAADSQ